MPRWIPKQASSPHQKLNAIEWPTLLLVCLVYSGWLLTLAFYQSLPSWVCLPMAIVLVTLHSSLQHEILHGHPTRWRAANRVMAIVPLSLWLPYERYRQAHLIHHIDEHLTDPLADPETFYWTATDWARLGVVSRTVLKWQSCLLGRVIVGPFWIVAQFLRAEAGRVVRNEANVRVVWAEHVAWSVPVIAFVTYVAGMPLWLYVVAIVMPSTGILLIRSFAEHRAVPETRERIAIVENSLLLGPLFLFNNLHAVHHEQPTMPWYRYHAWYRANRARLIAENGALVYNTYFDVARRFLLRDHDVLVHPLRPVRHPDAMGTRRN